jgi:hypothetical protein
LPPGVRLIGALLAEQNKPLDSARLIAINSWQKKDLLNRIYSRF